MEIFHIEGIWISKKKKNRLKSCGNGKHVNKYKRQFFLIFTSEKLALKTYYLYILEFIIYVEIKCMTKIAQSLERGKKKFTAV